ncbi:VanZ family protein [Clostridium estertheticum]|uniref:VanZ family protein n=1 Tax=Clostridium estertheticum TaxID=238834 RepID=UPI001CF0EFA4|nr:VanZ family protein [Clostridium estertheticum]MCB2357862.1 VanZ family protein [Clostridium estertheticum]
MFRNSKEEYMNIFSATIEKVDVKFSDVNFYVRKNAYFFQYFIFGILLSSIVRQSKLQRSNKIWILISAVRGRVIHLKKGERTIGS